MEEQLSHAPLAKTKRKKVLEGLAVQWQKEKELRQLKIVPYRVFYEVKGHTVEILLIRDKPPGKTTADLLREAEMEERKARKEESPMKKRKGFITVLESRRGKLVPVAIDVRGLDKEQIALGLDDELWGEIARRRRSRGRTYTLDEVCKVLGVS
jgi:hypothetical protein